MKLKLSRSAWWQLVAHATAEHPEEVAGFLLGHGRGAHAMVYLPAENSAPDPKQGFQLEPCEMLEAEDFARRSNLRVLGVAHSHPTQPSRLSETDVSTASNPVLEGWYWLVLSMTTDPPDARVFQVAADRAVTLVDLKIMN